MSLHSAPLRPPHRFELRNLSVGYATGKGPLAVASGLTATLRGGELTCLLGANGAGKSTLLRTLSGFQPPLGGTLCIDGRPLGSLHGGELARTVGVVLTERPSAALLTVRELVALGRTPYTGFWGRCTGEDWRVVDEALRTVGMEALAQRAVGTLSDGERQKAMVARALAQQTPVVLLDEPTAFLDYPSKVETMLLLRRVCRQTGRMVFLSTHDVDVALQLADTVWLMDRRRPLAVGTPEDLALSGLLSSFFESDSLVFAPRTGLFAIRLPVTRRVRAVGSDATRLALLRKALLRQGIGVAEEGVGAGCPGGAAAPLMAGVSVTVTATGFVVARGNEKATVRTVAGVVALLC